MTDRVVQPSEKRTARLLLKPLDDVHLDAYARLVAQPDVHRHLSRAAEIAADPRGQALRIIDMSKEHWQSRGYGPYAVFIRHQDGEAFVGRAGFFFVAHSEEVEINYMLDPSAWGRGCAPEIA